MVGGIVVLIGTNAVLVGDGNAQGGIVVKDNLVPQGQHAVVNSGLFALGHIDDQGNLALLVGHVEDQVIHAGGAFLQVTAIAVELANHAVVQAVHGDLAEDEFLPDLVGVDAAVEVLTLAGDSGGGGAAQGNIVAVEDAALSHHHAGVDVILAVVGGDHIAVRVHKLKQLAGVEDVAVDGHIAGVGLAIPTGSQQAAVVTVGVDEPGAQEIFLVSILEDHDLGHLVAVVHVGDFRGDGIAALGDEITGGVGVASPGLDLGDLAAAVELHPVVLCAGVGLDADVLIGIDGLGVVVPGGDAVHGAVLRADGAVHAGIIDFIAVVVGAAAVVGGNIVQRPLAVLLHVGSHVGAEGVGAVAAIAPAGVMAVDVILRADLVQGTIAVLAELMQAVPGAGVAVVALLVGIDEAVVGLVGIQGTVSVAGPGGQALVGGDGHVGGFLSAHGPGFHAVVAVAPVGAIVGVRQQGQALVGFGRQADIAVAVQEQGVAGLHLYLGDLLVVAGGQAVDAGPGVGVVTAVDGVLLVVDPALGDGLGRGLGEADVVHAVDVGVEDDIAHSQLFLSGDLAVLDLGVVILDSPSLGAAVVIGDGGHHEVNAQHVLGHAVVVVVDDAQGLAVVAVIKLHAVGVEVLADELAVGDLIGDIILAQGALGANVDFAVVHAIGAVNSLVVGTVEDALDQGHVDLGDLLADLDDLVVSNAIGFPLAAVALNQGSVGVGFQLDDVLDTPVGVVNLAGFGEVDHVLGALGQLQAALELGNLSGSALAVLDGVAAAVFQAGQGPAVLDVGVDAGAQQGRVGGDVKVEVLAIHIQAGLVLGQGLIAIQVSPLVGGYHAHDVVQAQVLLGQGLAGLGVAAGGQGAVGHGLIEDSAEEDLGDHFAGGGAAQLRVRDVVGDAQGLRQGSGADLPAGAAELAGLVVAQGTQHHGQGCVAGDVLAGLELVVAHANDQLGVSAVVDVTTRPVGPFQVGELGGSHVGVDTALGTIDIAGSDTVQDRRHFGAGDGLLGLKGAVGIAFEDL